MTDDKKLSISEMSKEPVEGYKFTDYDAAMIVEGIHEVDTHDEYIAAVQHLIDTGMAWKLQGFFGRTAQTYIESGQCHPKEGGSRG